MNDMEDAIRRIHEKTVRGEPGYESIAELAARSLGAEDPRQLTDRERVVLTIALEELRERRARLDRLAGLMENELIVSLVEPIALTDEAIAVVGRVLE